MISELKVKQFPFPSYDDWSKKYNFNWEYRLGEFIVKIAIVSWGCDGNRSNTYKIAISTNGNNPTNVYSPTIFQDVLDCEYNGYEIEYWYDYTTDEANKAFEQHILSYLQKFE